MCVTSAAYAQELDTKLVTQACQTAGTEHSALVETLRSSGWQVVEPANLSETDLALFTYAGLDNRIRPSDAEGLRWKAAWDMSQRMAGGLRLLKPSEGPRIYRSFLNAENAVLRAETYLVNGTPTRTICTLTASGQLAANMASQPLAEDAIALYSYDLTPHGSSALALFRPSLVTKLSGNPTIRANPDLVASLTISTDLNTEQVIQ